METARRNWSIRVSGLVQGVGFRPFVWRLAHDLGLAGTVRNTPAGVEIALSASDDECEALIARLRSDKPPLARVDRVEVGPGAGEAFDGFRILESGGGEIATGVVPDAAICADCKREIRDPANRRFGYPFANCTHCGPRLTIVEAIPYDRRRTAMRRFPMCPDCRAEYENPADRRFHAEPIACAACGPRIWLEDRDGSVPGSTGRELRQVADMLRGGAIVAIKGIGGFHLACRARDSDAVGRLRQRKRRDAKPFALMAADLATIHRHCRVSADEATLLASPVAPVVLLERRPDSGIASGVAPGHSRLGFMLPYSPLHVLLFDAIDDVLVMTSANASGEPQATGNDEARERLFPTADAILFHDRDIVNRVDDGVCRVDRTGVTLIRRARGHAPTPIALPEGFDGAPPVLALGGDLKGAFAFAARGQATLSQHLGDLDEVRTLAEFERTIALYRQMFGLAPRIIAVDAHPAYRSSALGRRLAEEAGARLVEIQHHHAHLASCLADNGVTEAAGPSLGIILDGLGWGDDGTIWGGEFLAGNYDGFERIAWFAPVALPGGDAAAREPWRNALAHLRSAFGPGGLLDACAGTGFASFLETRPMSTLGRMIDGGVNSPLSSSAGRLFDAAAAVLGICRERQDYEGQAAMELEAMAEPAFASAKPWAMPTGAAGPISWTSLWRALLADLADGVDRSLIAARFHRTLASVVTRTGAAMAAAHNLRRYVLSGGVFQNRLLLHAVHYGLAETGLPVLVHGNVPANDGGLALGQAAIAIARSRAP